MKKLLIIVVLVLLYQFREDIFSFHSPAPEYAAMHQEKVILYATSWCAYCAKTREFLEAKNIPYHEYDVEVSSEGYEQFKALGGRGVPLVLVNGKVIKGFNTDRILAYLK
ncbi:glutaredoxin family protein [Pseudoteredinibacter isoporae]|uniref:glutaredoxin family protein n=1 Tax=Pseudoteredinibacter isoporae TaxID=570281 RepID=UPI0031075CD8